MARKGNPKAGATNDVGTPRTLLTNAVLNAFIDDDEAVTIIDRSFRLVAVNTAWKSIMGLGDEVIGRTTEEIFGTSPQVSEQGFREVLAGKTVVKMFRPTEDSVLQQVKMRPWRDETGAIIGVVTRNSISQSGEPADGREGRLKVAMAMANLFTFEIDFRNGLVVQDPPQRDGGQHTGVHSFEDILITLSPDEQQDARRRWDEHLGSAGYMILETPYVRPDGGVSWYRSILEGIRNIEGDVVGIHGTGQLIDDQKRAQLALVAEKDAAQAADQAKSEFLANMSHEIRTPLTSVIGFSDVLSKLEGLPPAAQSYIQRISTAGQSLLVLINDILDFSKLEAGQVDLDPQPFEPVTCVQTVVDMLASQAQTKGVALKCDMAPALPACLSADSARISQVLVNLLGNAIKFTHVGEVCVTVGYEDDRLKISVSDTGGGIAAETRDRLFRRFSQVDGSISRRYGGTGLGLVICKSLVELMGGAIGCDTILGEGSTFWFTVPAPPAKLSAQQESACDEDQQGGGPAHILVVDDVATNRELVRAMLAPMGHSFEEADNGHDAIKAATRSHFDLILMDLQMPGMDGMTAARAIRATAQINRDTPILAFSANVLAEHTAAAFAAGMNDHIAKPIRPLELLTKVAMWTAPPEAREAGRQAG